MLKTSCYRQRQGAGRVARENTIDAKWDWGHLSLAQVATPVPHPAAKLGRTEITI